MRFMCLFDNLTVTVCALEDFKHVAHRRERIAEFVSKCGKKLVLTPICLGKIRGEPLNIIFQPLSFGDILADSRISNRLVRHRPLTSTPYTPSTEVSPVLKCTKANLDFTVDHLSAPAEKTRSSSFPDLQERKIPAH